VEFDDGAERWVPLSQIASESRLWYRATADATCDALVGGKAGLSMNELSERRTIRRRRVPDLAHAKNIIGRIALRHHPDRDPTALQRIDRAQSNSGRLFRSLSQVVIDFSKLTASF